MADEPKSLGPYRIIRLIARGGMGAVYEAVHTGLDKRVALKVLEWKLVGDRLDRFLREAKTAAALHHTNIVPVFDVGQVNGMPYYAMQFIDGQPLSDLVATDGTRTNAGPPPAPGTRTFDPAAGDGTRTHHGDPGATATGSFPQHPADPVNRGLTPPARQDTTRPDPEHVAALGLQAAEGLAHAHARGIVHRDVKPANLILDNSGVVWVTDFGLAFRTDDPALTTEGAILGTPRYMSPEQAQARKTDARTDVYSLGVTLYELLTNTSPFAAATVVDTIARVLAHTPPGPRSLNPTVSRDLETVVLKAMAKRPEDRYPTARELADDLKRYLAGEPVKARRITVVGTAWRWAKRNPAVAGLLAAVVLVFATGAGVSAYFARQAKQREREAADNYQQAKDNADTATRYANDLTTLLNFAKSEEARALAAEATGRRLLHATRVSLATSAFRQGNYAQVSDVLRDTLPEPGADDLRGWEWNYLFRQIHAEARVALLPEGGRVLFASPARIIQEAGPDNTRLRVIDPATGVVLFEKDTTATMAAALRERLQLVFSADGKRAAVRRGGQLVVWDVDGGKDVFRESVISVDAVYSRLALSDDGSRVAWGLAADPERQGAGKDRPLAVLVWEVVTGKPGKRPVPDGIAGGAMRLLRFSPDGRWLIGLFATRWVLWEAGTGRVVLDRSYADPAAVPNPVTLPAGNNWRAVFDRAGNRVAVRNPGPAARIEVFDLAGAEPKPVATVSGSGDFQLAPDGTRLIAFPVGSLGGADELVAHDLARPNAPPETVPTGLVGRPGELQLSPSGDELLVLPQRLITQFLQTGGPSVMRTSQSPSAINQFAVVRLPDPAPPPKGFGGAPAPRRNTPQVFHSTRPLTEVMFGPAGDRVIGVGTDGIREWAVAPKVVTPPAGVRLAPDGLSGILFRADPMDRFRLLGLDAWDGRTGTGTSVFELNPGDGIRTTGLTAIAWSPDGKQVGVYVRHKPQELAFPPPLLPTVPGLAAHLAVADEVETDWLVVVDPAATRVTHAILLTGVPGANWVRFTPDGRTVLVGRAAQTVGPGANEEWLKRVVVYDLETGRERVRLTTTGDGLVHATLSPAGDRIAVARSSSVVPASKAVTEIEVRLMATGEVVARTTFPGRNDARMEFSPCGRWLLLPLGTGTFGDSVRGQSIRDTADPRLKVAYERPEILRGVAVNSVFSPDGRLLASPLPDGRLRITELATGREVATLLLRFSRRATVQFSGDGRRVLARSSDDDRSELQVWDAATGQELLAVPNEAADPTLGDPVPDAVVRERLKK